MRVMFIHCFSVDEQWSLWKKNRQTEYPAYYLWGITHLEQYGIEVKVLPYEKYPLLRKIGKFLKLGNLDHQIRVFFQQSDYDVIYSPCQTSTVFLSMLSCIGLLRKPVVVKLERPFNVNWRTRLLMKFFAQGHAKILCLSSRIKDQLKNDFGIDEDKLPLLDWGPDLSYYDDKKSQVESNGQFILSCGSVSRDYNTLAKAFATINYPLEIYCSQSSVPDPANISSNVTVKYRKNSQEARALSFEELIEKYQQSYAVAIPIEVPKDRKNNTTLVGLTGLLEAMALGKAVVMTKHKQINIDIEKEGIGIWVEPDDINGWEKAISYLLAHPEETKQMGINARKLCEDKYNLNLFSSQLASTLKKCFVLSTQNQSAIYESNTSFL